MTDDLISKEEGGGGKAMDEFLKNILSRLELTNTREGIGLDELDDGAVIRVDGKNLVFTTDSHVVSPLFFQGGDIGSLSVSGTVNDLSMMGAKPLALSTSFILGEGFPREKLEKITDSINETCKKVKVPVVTGDTKVIEENIGLIVNTAGIGLADKVVQDSGLQPGDRLIVSGSLGDHGIAIMADREGIGFESSIESDCAPLWPLVKEVLQYAKALKDPTRGGLANAVNEMAEKSRVKIFLREEDMPVKKEVEAASKMLGIDPLTVANEGKFIVGVEKEDSEKVLEIMREHPLGKDATIIGEIKEKDEGPGVILETAIGGKRILEKPVGDPVPRVC